MFCLVSLRLSAQLVRGYSSLAARSFHFPGQARIQCHHRGQQPHYTTPPPPPHPPLPLLFLLHHLRLPFTKRTPSRPPRAARSIDFAITIAIAPIVPHPTLLIPPASHPHQPRSPRFHHAFPPKQPINNLVSPSHGIAPLLRSVSPALPSLQLFTLYTLNCFTQVSVVRPTSPIALPSLRRSTTTQTPPILPLNSPASAALLRLSILPKFITTRHDTPSSEANLWTEISIIHHISPTLPLFLHRTSTPSPVDTTIAKASLHNSHHP